MKYLIGAIIVGVFVFLVLSRLKRGVLDVGSREDALRGAADKLGGSVRSGVKSSKLFFPHRGRTCQLSYLFSGYHRPGVHTDPDEATGVRLKMNTAGLNNLDLVVSSGEVPKDQRALAELEDVVVEAGPLIKGFTIKATDLNLARNLLTPEVQRTIQKLANQAGGIAIVATGGSLIAEQDKAWDNTVDLMRFIDDVKLIFAAYLDLVQ